MCRNIRTLFNFEPPATVLTRSLTTTSAPRDRVEEEVKAQARSGKRFRLKLPD